MIWSAQRPILADFGGESCSASGPVRAQTGDLQCRAALSLTRPSKRASARVKTVQNTLGTFSLHPVCYVPGEFARVLRGGFLRLAWGRSRVSRGKRMGPRCAVWRRATDGDSRKSGDGTEKPLGIR